MMMRAGKKKKGGGGGGGGCCFGREVRRRLQRKVQVGGEELQGNAAQRLEAGCGRREMRWRFPTLDERWRKKKKKK